MGIKVGSSTIKNVKVEDRDYRAPLSDPTPWVRNPDWIDMPDIATGESKLCMVFCVRSGEYHTNRMALRMRQEYSVELA